MLVPIGGPTRASFLNSGAEAVENAVNIARLYTGRPAVIAFEGHFTPHAARDDDDVQGHPFNTGMGAPRPRSSRTVPGRIPRPVCSEALAELEELFTPASRRPTWPRSRSSRRSARPGSCRRRRSSSRDPRSLDRHGIVLIADEVQTGSGRTGLMFAMEHYGIEPDLIVIAKSIAAGVPLSVLLGWSMMDAPHLGAIGGTYIGNPLALAAALAVHRRLRRGRSLATAEGIGDRIRDRMLAWQQRWPQIGDVRGLGAMLAIQLVEDPVTKKPATGLAAAVMIESSALSVGHPAPGRPSGNCIRCSLCPLDGSRTPLGRCPRRVGRGARRRARMIRPGSDQKSRLRRARRARGRARPDVSTARNAPRRLEQLPRSSR